MDEKFASNLKTVQVCCSCFSVIRNKMKKSEKLEAKVEDISSLKIDGKIRSKIIFCTSQCLSLTEHLSRGEFFFFLRVALIGLRSVVI